LLRRNQRIERENKVLRLNIRQQECWFKEDANWKGFDYQRIVGLIGDVNKRKKAVIALVWRRKEGDHVKLIQRH
jgi:hypothetical protein